MLQKRGTELLCEVHEHFSMQKRLAEKGFWVYDFALPMLTLQVRRIPFFSHTGKTCSKLACLQNTFCEASHETRLSFAHKQHIQEHLSTAHKRLSVQCILVDFSFVLRLMFLDVSAQGHPAGTHPAVDRNLYRSSTHYWTAANFEPVPMAPKNAPT